MGTQAWWQHQRQTAWGHQTAGHVREPVRECALGQATQRQRDDRGAEVMGDVIGRSGARLGLGTGAQMGSSRVPCEQRTRATWHLLRQPPRGAHLEGGE